LNSICFRNGDAVFGDLRHLRIVFDHDVAALRSPAVVATAANRYDPLRRSIDWRGINTEFDVLAGDRFADDSTRAF